MERRYLIRGVKETNEMMQMYSLKMRHSGTLDEEEDLINIELEFT